MSAPPSDRLLLTVGECAATLALGRTLIYKLVASGELPSIQIGRARRVPKVWLEAFVERQVRTWEEQQKAR